MTQISGRQDNALVHSVLQIFILLLLPFAINSFSSSLPSSVFTPIRHGVVRIPVLFASDEIYQKTRECDSVEAILDLCEENKENMPPPNVSFCWNQLSWILRDFKKQREIEQKPDLLEPLLALTIQTSDRMNSRSVAVISHRMALISSKSKLRFDSEIWDVLENRALTIPKFDSKDISNMVWAYAKVQQNAPALFNHFANGDIMQIKRLDSQAISNILWSYAKTGHKSPTLFDDAAGIIIRNFHRFTPQGISNTLWSYAKSGIHSPELFDAAADEVIKKLDTFKHPRDISNTVWSYARASHSSPKLFDAMAVAASKKMCRFRPQGIAITLFSYAKMSYRSPKLFGTATDEVMKKLDKFKPQEISTILYSCAKVRQVSPKLFDAATDGVIKNLDKFKPQSISNTVWAYATARRVSPKLFDTAAVEAIKKMGKFRPSDISNTLWSYATFGHPSFEMFDVAIQQAIQNLNAFQEYELCSVLWALAAMDYYVESSIPIFQRIFELHQLNEYQFSNSSLILLHPVILWFSAEHEENIEIPTSLAIECRTAYTKNQVNPSKYPSELQNDVISTLGTLDLDLRKKIICEQTGYIIDAIITSDSGAEIAVVVDGWNRFVDQVPTGWTLLKRRQLSNLGGRALLWLPYWEWDALSLKEKANFLEEKIQTVVSS